MRLLYPSTVNSYNGEMVSVYWKRSLMLTLYYTWISNYNIHYNACDETTYPYQTSMAPLKFLNGWLILSHTLLSTWLRIHAVIKVNQDTDVSRQTYWSENKIMACHLFSTKPLSESVWDYYTLDPWEKFSVKFETKYNNSHAPQMNFKMLSAKQRSFCLGLNTFTDLMCQWVQSYMTFNRAFTRDINIHFDCQHSILTIKPLI